MKMIRECAGYYRWHYKGEVLRVAKIRAGHWEMMANGEYYETACSFAESKDHAETWKKDIDFALLKLNINERYLIEVLMCSAMDNHHLRGKINKALAIAGKNWGYLEELVRKISITD